MQISRMPTINADGHAFLVDLDGLKNTPLFVSFVTLIDHITSK